MKKYNFLAFDIGATSGRAVLGTLVGDKFEMQELHRFPNAIMELHGKYYWDIYRFAGGNLPYGSVSGKWSDASSLGCTSR